MLELPQYQEHRERDVRIESAKTAIRAILTLDLYPAHKRELLSTCIWKITEADGKFRTRFRSIGSLNTNIGTKLQHEHVIERRKLISQLLDGTKNVDDVAEEAIGCVVTREEHVQLNVVSRLDPNLGGWSRYVQAGIRVFDLKAQAELEF